MDIEQELNTILITEIARELVESEYDSVDSRVFNQVVQMITSPAGTHNAYDAPVLYAIMLAANN